jgi:hypothetical protein
MSKKVWFGNMKGRDHLISRGIILKWVIVKYDVKM